MKPLLLLWAFLLACIVGLHFGLRPRHEKKALLAQRLLLTDLCLTTESRHTRNVSLPEPIAPFQDFAGYHEHFPSSSFFWKW